jgi:hypothetical protein
MAISSAARQVKLPRQQAVRAAVSPILVDPGMPLYQEWRRTVTGGRSHAGQLMHTRGI